MRAMSSSTTKSTIQSDMSATSRRSKLGAERVHLDKNVEEPARKGEKLLPERISRREMARGRLRLGRAKAESLQDSASSSEGGVSPRLRLRVSEGKVFARLCLERPGGASGGGQMTEKKRSLSRHVKKWRAKTKTRLGQTREAEHNRTGVDG